MDYYSKYIKYKIKYMNLRKQIEGGKVGDKCEIDTNCSTKTEYCSKGTFTKNTCQPKKGRRGTCDRDAQCNGSCKKTFLSGNKGECTY